MLCIWRSCGVSGRFLLREVGPLTGTGLFSGRPCSITIGPGGLGSGRAGGRHSVIFKNPQSGAVAPADIDAVTRDTQWSGLPRTAPVRNTTLNASPEWLVNGGERPSPPTCVVATIEHVMAALAGLGVWDARVELTGPEVPILDGSALPFVELLRPALSERIEHGPDPIVLTEPIEVRDGAASICATPSPAGTRRYAYELDYGPGAVLPPQRAEWTGSPTDFALKIAQARTFSPVAEAQAARTAGLFAHVTAAEMVVIGNDGKPIDNAWRIEHEPATHKLLDLIGDLALLGAPLMADVVAIRSGHALTHAFCREVLRVCGRA